MKKIFLIAALCFMALTEHAGAKAVKLWTAGGDDDGRGLAVRDNDRTICPKGKTKSGSVCVNCDTVLSNCEWCSSTTVCTKCQKGYIVKDGRCKKDGCNTDADCEANQSCDTIAKKCETLDCQRGTYLKDHKCLKCPDECTECKSATVCTACKTNYELEGTECTQIKCSAGQYVEHSACHPCSEAIENCGECSTSKTCTKCENGTVLEYGKCVEPKCREDADCKETEKCNGTTKMCEKVVCDDGYEVSDHACLPISTEDPECAENTDCEGNEVCVDGGTETAACVPLECKDPNQKVENHECVTDECQGKKVGTCAYLYETCPTGWEQVNTTPSCKVCNPKTDGYNGEPCASGPGQCNTNDDCPNYYQVCSDHKCVNAKSCEDLRPPSRYRSTATQGYAGPTYINVVNLSCYIKQGGETTCKSMGYESSCSAGYGATSTGKTGSDGTCYTCTLCSEGYYSAGGTASCTRCSTGTTCGNGAKSSSQCRTETACSVHEQCASNQACTNDNCGSLAGAQMHGLCNPLSCSKGQYVSNHYCKPCEAGYQGSVAGVCTACPKGTYAAGTGNSSCTSCPSGQTTSGTGSTSSSACYSSCSGTTCSSYNDCSYGYTCSNGCCQKCASGSNETKYCKCGTEDISTGYGQCQGSSYCFLSCSNIPNCNSCSTKTSCGFTSYVCSSCKSGYKVTGSGICVPNGDSGQVCPPACGRTTTGCSFSACSWHGNGKCTRSHAITEGGHVTCDTCSVGTRTKIGSNDFYSCCTYNCQS